MFFDTEIFDKAENVKDKAEKEEAQSSLSQVPSVVNKASWGQYIDKSQKKN